MSNVSVLQQKVWGGSIPLRITLSPLECRNYDQSMPYFIQAPRISYLPALLPRLHAFFTAALINPDLGAHEGWLSFEGVPLKWQHPLGLLYDLYSGAEPASLDDIEGSEKNSSTLPWSLVLHFSEWPSDQLIPMDAAWKIPNDVFMNSVKEAAFLRSSHGKVIMHLGKDDSTKLWESVQDHDLDTYNSINHKLWNPPGGLQLRHLPMKVYLPTAAVSADSEGSQRTLRVVQGLVPPTVTAREAQTLGTALHSLLPTLFPSRRSYIHAKAVLHGAVVPLTANAQELVRSAAYADGFLHVAIIMQG